MRTVYEYDPTGSTEEDIVEDINTFLNQYDSSTVSDEPAEKAVWLMEAGLNKEYGDLRSVETIKSDSFFISVSTNNSFTGNQIEDYYYILDSICQKYLDTTSVDSAQISVVDLSLGDSKIEIEILMSRTFVPGRGRYWMCHEEDEYTWSAWYGATGWLPSYYCPNTSNDYLGINVTMMYRISSKLRGYDCNVYTYNDPVPMPCDYSTGMIYSIGSITNSGMTTGWGGTGCYSSTYHRLMPHNVGNSTGGYDNECYNGPAIECISDDRVTPWVTNKIHSLYSSSTHALNVRVNVGTWPGNNAQMTHSLTIYYGKCANEVN